MDWKSCKFCQVLSIGHLKSCPTWHDLLCYMNACEYQRMTIDWVCMGWFPLRKYFGLSGMIPLRSWAKLLYYNYELTNKILVCLGWFPRIGRDPNMNSGLRCEWNDLYMQLVWMIAVANDFVKMYMLVSYFQTWVILTGLHSS